MEDSKEKLLKAIRHYQDSLERHTKTGNGEKLLHAIEKLSRLPIKVCHLEETGIGRTVNGLKKVEGKVGENARNLVDKWKSMVKGEDDAELERIEKKGKEKSSEPMEANIEDEDPVPGSLQICDEDEECDNGKPCFVETDFPSYKKFSSSDKDNHNGSDRYKDNNKRSRSVDKLDKKSKHSHSSEQSNDDSDRDSDSNHKPKKLKYNKDSYKKTKNSSHKGHGRSSDSESQSESASDDSDSERESSPGRKQSRQASRRNSSVSSDRSSSDSEHSSENDSSSETDSIKNKYKEHHSDKKGKRSHSNDHTESNSDSECREKYSKSKEKDNRHNEKQMSRKHSKSNSESDKEKRSKSSNESKDKHNKSKEKTHDSGDRYSKSKKNSHEKRDREKESSSRKDGSSSKSQSKHGESKHIKDKKEPEKLKSKSDSDKDSKKSNSNKYMEFNGNLDSTKCFKTHKEKESSSKSTHNKRRDRDSSTDKEGKKHKGSNSDCKESKSKSHRSSTSSSNKDKEISEGKKNSENKKEKQQDKKDRGEGEKSKKESSSSSSGSKERDKSKTSTSSSSSKPKMSPKKLPIINGIDSESGASFADVLGMLEAPVYSKNKKKSSTVVSQEKSSSEKSFSKGEKASTSKSSVSSSVGGPSSLSKETAEVPNLLKDPGELEPLDINMTSLLPSITPNYRPLSLPLDSQPKKLWTDDEALTRVINAKHQRTKVYSGNKVTYTKVPTLFDLCSRILQDNIDALEYTGGVPYSILKPIIEKANPDQLFQLEFHNPYLIEDSDELWLLHCQKEFRTKKREEMESWRDMYLRCLDEREAKLKALTANIKQSQDVKVPVRTTKLAYLDSVVKPPRNIARKQAKNGTAVNIKRPSQTPTERLNQLAKSGEAGKVAVPNPGKAAAEKSSSSHSQSSHFKPKKAPLMAKTLSLLKNRFGRR